MSSLKMWCELSICVCLEMKHIKLPGQHLPKLIMLQKMIISQIKPSLDEFKNRLDVALDAMV